MLKLAAASIALALVASQAIAETIDVYSDVRQWITAHGGLTHDFIWMAAPDIYNYFRKC